MTQEKPTFWKRWTAEKQHARGMRARERQLEYQEKKAEEVKEEAKIAMINIVSRARSLRQRLEKVQPIPDSARVLEVGSGAHGLIFGFGGNFGVGVDPLAVDYKRLFPTWQQAARTIAAIGEELPFGDAAFDVVLSDNVIDHAEKPLVIIDELIRVLKPGGLLYFTVNIHHPIYDAASKAHGAWNAIGLHFELSPFADHTIHLTENRIKAVMARQPIKIIEENSSVRETKAGYRRSRSLHPEQLLKKVFFKNALYELIAVRK